MTQRGNWRSKNRQKVTDMGRFVGLIVEETKKVEPKPEVKEEKAEKKAPKKKTK